MSGDGCPGTVVVTTQADIENGHLTSCSREVNPGTIYIQNGTGTFNFTTLSTAYQIEVSNSPLLKVLDFPLLEYFGSFTVDNAQSLSTLWLPHINIKQDLGFLGSFNITGAPSLEKVYLSNMTKIDSVVLMDAGLMDKGSDDVHLQAALENVTSAGSVHTNRCPSLSSLTSIDTLWISTAEPCYVDLSYLHSVGDLILGNISRVFLNSELTVDRSLVLDRGTTSDRSDFDMITSIGSDANITSNANLPLNFSKLTTVGGSIFVANNTNCTIDLDRLVRVGNLSITDNSNTTLPVFPALERAEDIHLRGYMNTSADGNIFPDLVLATGTVTIESSNDFNCSKLASQQQRGIINSLFCNETDNSTNTAVTPLASPASLSGGAWAGIGVGIAVFVIGSIVAIACCTIHIRQLLKDIELVKLSRPNRDGSRDDGPHQQNVEGWHEADGQGILREKPDDHIREMQVPPAEMLDDHVPAMPSSPVELPGGSPGSGGSPTSPGTGVLDQQT